MKINPPLQLVEGTTYIGVERATGVAAAAF